MSLVELYRNECPPGYDPQCVIASAIVAIVAVVAALASAGAGAYSAVASSDAQHDAAKFNAAVAQNNATAAAQQAEFAAEQIRTKNRRIIAAGRANLAASGVTESGSATDLLLDSSIQGELNAASAIYTGRVTSGAQSAQAQLEESRASWARTAGGIGVGTSILGGLSSATSIAANPNFRG